MRSWWRDWPRELELTGDIQIPCPDLGFIVNQAETTIEYEVTTLPTIELYIKPLLDGIDLGDWPDLDGDGEPNVPDCKYEMGLKIVLPLVEGFTGDVDVVTLVECSSGDLQETTTLFEIADGIIKDVTPGATTVLDCVGGSGGGSIYIEITGSSSPNDYTASSYDNPTDRNLIASGLTAKAMQHTNGTLTNSGAGKGFWSTLANGIYYFEPSVMYS